MGYNVDAELKNSWYVRGSRGLQGLNRPFVVKWTAINNGDWWRKSIRKTEQRTDFENGRFEGERLICVEFWFVGKLAYFVDDTRQGATILQW